MKVAVSIPDDVFAQAEQVVQKLKTSRSAFYAEAVRKLILEHDDDAVIEQMNAIVDSLSEEEKRADLRFVDRAAAQLAPDIEW